MDLSFHLHERASISLQKFRDGNRQHLDDFCQTVHDDTKRLIEANVYAGGVTSNSQGRKLKRFSKDERI